MVRVFWLFWKKMNKPIVHILTAVHNDWQKTEQFLKCVKKQNYKNINTWVVDDGSADLTSEKIKKNFKFVKIIKGDGNLWWTGSLYKGVSKILKIANDDDLILTINNDCKFDKNYLSNLVDCLVKNGNSVVGSCVLDENTKKIWDAGVYIKWNPLNFYSIFKKDQNNFDTLSSKGTLFPISLVKKIGNFDKHNFPHYLSDYDYFYTARKSGYNLFVSYEAKVLNNTKRTGNEGKIEKQISYLELYNLLFDRKSKVNIVDHFRFIRKHCPLKYKPFNYFVLILKIGHYLSHVFPFYLLILLFNGMKKVFGIENKSLKKLIFKFE